MKKKTVSSLAPKGAGVNEPKFSATGTGARNNPNLIPMKTGGCKTHKRKG